MTQTELAALKAEIKAELLQEMRKAPGVRVPRPWMGVAVAHENRGKEAQVA